MKKRDLRIFVNIPTLETERLMLRKIKNYDLKDIFEYSHDPKVSEFLLWSPHESEYTTKMYIKTVKKYYRAAKFYDWAIVHKDTGKMIGTCGFTDINIITNSAEIGYVLNSDFWGQGIACEALQKVLNFAFEKLELQYVEAKYMINNERSKRVLEKSNMKYIGKQINAIEAKGKYHTIGIFAISKSDYFSQKS